MEPQYSVSRALRIVLGVALGLAMAAAIGFAGWAMWTVMSR
jgi:hypothetical protein